MSLSRGGKAASKEDTCEPCRNNRHSECVQELREQGLAAWESAGVDDSYPFAPPPPAPWCRCFSMTDIHV